VKTLSVLGPTYNEGSHLKSLLEALVEGVCPALEWLDIGVLPMDVSLKCLTINAWEWTGGGDFVRPEFGELIEDFDCADPTTWSTHFC